MRRVKLLADVLIGLSILAVIFAIVGSFGKDIWIASTQWVIIAAALSAWAIYLRIREQS